MRVKQKSAQITRQSEAPFSFWERDKHRVRERKAWAEAAQVPPKHSFKANPIPKACSVLIYEQRREEEEQARQKRIHEAAEISHALSKMPSRMQKDQERKSQFPSKAQEEQYSFRPKIGEMKTHEMFKAMQRKFEASLLSKKSQASSTKPVSPKFTKTKTRPLERN